MCRCTLQGENVSIQCCAENAFAGTAGGGVGYMWTRNGEAVKMEAPRLYYEELYRKRSILYVNDVQVSIAFAYITTRFSNKNNLITAGIYVNVARRLAGKNKLWQTFN